MIIAKLSEALNKNYLNLVFEDDECYLEVKPNVRSFNINGDAGLKNDLAIDFRATLKMSGGMGEAKQEINAGRTHYNVFDRDESASNYSAEDADIKFIEISESSYELLQIYIYQGNDLSYELVNAILDSVVSAAETSDVGLAGGEAAATEEV